MRIDVACFSVGFLYFIHIMTTNVTVSHDLISLVKYLTDPQLFSSSPLTPEEPKAARATACFEPCGTDWLSGIHLFLASQQSNKTGNYCSHLAVLPLLRMLTGVSVLYPGPGFRCFIGTSYLWYLPHFIKCDWKWPVESEIVGEEATEGGGN